MHVCAQSLSSVQLFMIPCTVACQAPLSMGFSRQKYWSGLPFPTPGDLPNQGIKTASSASAGRFFTTSTTWEAPKVYYLTSFLLLIYPFSKHLLSTHYVVGTPIGTGCIVCLHGSYILVVGNIKKYK